MKLLLIIPIMAITSCSTPCYEVCDYLLGRAEQCLDDIPDRQGSVDNTINREICARFFGALNEIVKGKDAQCMEFIANGDDVDCTNVWAAMDELFDSNSDGGSDI